MSSLRFGLDFGTSNSSFAIFDGSRLTLVPLDAHGVDPRVMRSLLYVSREGDVITGQRALDTYMEQNTGRPVHLEPAWLGDITMHFADLTITKEAFAMVDANAPGRLFQSLKRFLPQTSFRATNVFGRHYTLEELVGRLAREMLGAAERHLGQPVERLTVGRPVHFSTDAVADDSARERLAAAFREAGVPYVTFLEEPIAAAIHYASEAGPGPGVGVVFDFGGGTLDVTVVRLGESQEVLSTGGVPIGGDLIDSLLVESRLLKHFGSGARYVPEGLPMPRHVFKRLLSWQNMIALNHPELLGLIQRARRSTDQPEQLAALEYLVTQNYGLALFRAVEEAKVRLSSEEEAVVTLALGESLVREPIARPELEQAVGPLVRKAAACLLAACAEARVEPEAVTAVITTGGSSLIPAFREMLRETFPKAALTATDTFTSVAAGLAIQSVAR